MNILWSMLLVLVTIYGVPILVYGLASAFAGVKQPEGVSPARFLLGVLVSKSGTAIAFVLIYYFAAAALAGQWPLYALLWWVMLVFGEIGQAIGPNYPWKEAVAGIVSETLYLPVSAYWVDALLG